MKSANDAAQTSTWLQWLSSPWLVLVSLCGSWVLLQFSRYGWQVARQSPAAAAALILALIYLLPSAAWLFYRLPKLVRRFRKAERRSDAGGVAEPDVGAAGRSRLPPLALAAPVVLVPPALAGLFLIHSWDLYRSVFSITGDTERRRRLMEEAASLDAMAFGPGARRSAFAAYAGRYGNDRRTLPESEWAWRKVLEGADLAHGQSDVLTMRALQSLGRVCLEQRKFSQSEEFCLKYLSLCDARLAEKGVVGGEREALMSDREAVLRSLAAVYLERGENDKSEPVLRQAILSGETLYGPRHVMASVEELADLYISSGRLSEAEPLSKLSFDFRKTELARQRWSGDAAGGGSARQAARGPDAEKLARACERYARVLRLTGRHDEAALYEKMAEEMKAP